MKYIDNFLNSITMYRLVLYYLILLLLVAGGLASFGLLNFNPLNLLGTTLFILVVCWVANKIFAYVFEGPTNFESVYISSLILALIITPVSSTTQLIPLFWMSLWTIASKYIFAYKSKHIFNPVAFGANLVGLTIAFSPTWWVGTLYMLPFVLTGLLIVRKVRRYDLVFYFFVTSLLTILTLSFMKGSDPLTTLRKTFVDSPILFFAFVMLTEPLTTPSTKILQSIYGAIVGVLFSPQFHVGAYYTTPEMALVLGNVFSYIVSPKQKLLLKLKEKIQVGNDIYDFIWSPSSKPSYSAGQYMEWTLGYKNPDSRGNRRYFTLASSPTEPELRLGIKFYTPPSGFKKTLGEFKVGDKIVASQVAGDFTLPKDVTQKLVFIAGGIGVTPFRSMIKYLIDTQEKREIVMFYSNNKKEEIVYEGNPQSFAYKELFDQAEKHLGIKTIYTLTDMQNLPSDWVGEKGIVTKEMIQKYVTDFKQRTFYISGPHMMVDSFEKTLKDMGVPKSQIKIDFFPGFA